MSDLKSLIRKRGDVKRRLTAFMTFLNEIDSIEDKNTQIRQLEIRLRNVEQFLHEFNTINIQILELCDEKDVEEYNKEADMFEIKYYNAITVGEQLLKDRFVVNQENEEIHSQGSRNIQALSQHLQSVKLPTIQLAKFDGHFENWLEFKDSFESLIHTNESLGNIQKFHYLRASLSGTAAQIIHSLEFSAANYNIAWNLLIERFNNKRLLVHNHVTAIFEVNAIAKESAIQIRALIDTIEKHLRALQILGEPVEYWDTLIIHAITKKLDYRTLRDWETEINQSSAPKYAELKQFLNRKADLLETIESSSKGTNNFRLKTRQTGLVSTPHKHSCNFCKGDHVIYKCEKFLKLQVSERKQHVEKLKLCENCLQVGHKTDNCRHSFCRKCNLKHSTLIHEESVNNTTNVDEKVSLYSHTVNHTVLLSTAIVKVRAADDTVIECRALLDSGSQCNFITKQLCNRLNIKACKTNISIIGIGTKMSDVNHQCDIKFSSRDNTYQLKILCLIINSICDLIPAHSFEIPKLSLPANVMLADPEFNHSKSVDLLIGAGVFWNIINADKISLGKHLPILQDSRLGWIVTGQIPVKSNKLHCGLSITTEIHKQLRKFWEIDEIHTELSSECENYCETHFLKHYSRDNNGRFIVRIPFNDSIANLGDSYQLAEKRLNSVERKFTLQPNFRDLYCDFMAEYEHLGHMTQIQFNENPQYFLPHHGVLKENNVTTKLRVVFDGSAISNTGISLNCTQFNGPTIQDELLSILLRFRQHTYVLSADIKQMYRQILVHPADRQYQRILWRTNHLKPIQVYELNTVTYGTTSAPYLAIRSLYQLGLDAENTNPVAARVIKHDFYVDDLLTGGNDEGEVIALCTQVRDILASACFPLHKWVSNNSNIVNALAISSSQETNVSICPTEINKTLGIFYSSTTDTLTYKYDIPLIKATQQVTKRMILSIISKIYDPLGLLGPFIILAKILLQKLWLCKVNWDQPVPYELAKQFIDFNNQFVHLAKLKIPRHITCTETSKIEYHGFCDASVEAYAACIYVRTIKPDGTVTMSLLCAKTRVAPLKKLTVPRLELCGALILAELMKRVQGSLTLTAQTFYWCDSQVVLHWIHAEPGILQQFISHRVATIQKLSNAADWRYVNTKHNAADMLSRGSPLKNLIDETHTWWTGPLWLYDQNPYIENFKPDTTVNLPELKQKSTALVSHPDYEFGSDLLKRFSSFLKLNRVVSYCLRFASNTKQRKENRYIGPLTPIELNKSLKVIVRISQSEDFKDEIHLLKSNKQLPRKHKLLGLSPYIDHEGLLRVGGRLDLSDLPAEAKHPLLLSSKNNLTVLIFRHTHDQNLHCGPQLLLSTIRQRYWPINGRNLARKIVHECIKCYRFNTQKLQPRMGNLPRNRATIKYPFQVSGVDYAGPFTIKDRSGRGCKISKAYLCLFVCFTTRALHLEAVSDLRSETFIAALRRFASRRGKPDIIYSDNGTNFVGAANELKHLQNFLSNVNSDITDILANENIEWKFIPAHSPHMGGLWEAGVKSVKCCLKRVIGNVILTYEEFITILTQIESTLNSRPLFPMSSNPNDLNPLTPVHFLVGRPSNTVPDVDLQEVKINSLNRFQFIQRMHQNFWARWSKDYISELQQKTKWKELQPSLTIDKLVLIREDNLPPQKWLLGRIVELHQGRDGIARVASIKTQHGVIKRAVNKLCVLPSPENE